MVDSMKCPVFMSEIPDTIQKVDCPLTKNYEYSLYFLLIPFHSASKVTPFEKIAHFNGKICKISKKSSFFFIRKKLSCFSSFLITHAKLIDWSEIAWALKLKR